MELAFQAPIPAALGGEMARNRGVGSQVVVACQMQKELQMDREHVKGAADKVKGAVKEAAGKVTGDTKLETEGKIDKAKGAAHNAVGDAKDAVRKATD
jgi:uncharacterized protein YjbJ (UPF0337 family)